MTFIELFYGIWISSFGFINESCHMLWDCVILFICLSATLIAKKKPDRQFSYGYDRIEVLSGYMNGLYLLLVTLSIFFQAINQLFYSSEIISNRLVSVAIVSILVNVVGLLLFRSSYTRKVPYHVVGKTTSMRKQQRFLQTIDPNLKSKREEES